MYGDLHKFTYGLIYTLATKSGCRTFDASRAVKEKIYTFLNKNCAKENADFAIQQTVVSSDRSKIEV